MMNGFVVPSAGPGTPDSVDRRRQMAAIMLRESGGAQPIQSPWQGAAKMAQALLGGMAMRNADTQEAAGRKGANEALVRALTRDAGANPMQSDPQGALVNAMNDPWMSPQGQQMLMSQWQKANQPPPDPAEAEFARLRNEKLKADIAQMQNPQAQQPELGLNPQFGVDANGNPVMIQVGKDGKAVQTAMPDGVTLSKEPIKLDAGTSWILLDPITRQPVGQVPKDLAGAERQKEIGAAEGKAQSAASGDLASAEMALTILDSIQNDPNMDWGVGGSSVFNVIPGTPGRDFQSKVDQATSGAFLSAIQQMRGMGALSNAEGQTATQAITRMSTSQSKEEFLSALNDYRAIVEAGKARAEQRLGIQPQAPSPAQGNPTPDAEGWTTLPSGVRIRQKGQ